MHPGKDMKTSVSFLLKQAGISAFILDVCFRPYFLLSLYFLSPRPLAPLLLECEVSADFGNDIVGSFTIKVDNISLCYSFN